MHVLIVDDEPAIADVLAYALNSENFKTECLTLGHAAIERVRAGGLSMVLLDVGLPDINGFDVCRSIRSFSDVPIIFLTARSEEVDRIVGLELGADDYVSKPFSPREVASRVRAILRRTQANGNGHSPKPEVASSKQFVIDNEGLRITYRGSLLHLTRYEFRLLAVLLERPGRVLSRTQLMDTVWHDAEESLERTVDAHIKTVRGKLRAVFDGDDPIETHRGLGYSISNDTL
jgi:two-component system catabolic regulation response regulator CreB